MITSKTVRTVTDMRKEANDLLRLATRLKQPIGIFKHNKLQAYLVDADTLENLESLAEEYLDSKIVSERLYAKKSEFRNFEKFWAKNRLPR